ncbi:hypothetical protein AMTRI_Chr08g167230 [Amborella trichopoda]
MRMKICIYWFFRDRRWKRRELVTSIHSLLFYWWFLLCRIFFADLPVVAVVTVVHHCIGCYFFSCIKLLTIGCVCFFGIWPLTCFSLFIIFLEFWVCIVRLSSCHHY